MRFPHWMVVVIFLVLTGLLYNSCKEQPLLKKIGFHEAVYDQSGRLMPWTGWEDAMKREMNWYFKAPIGKPRFPVYFYSTFLDSAYHAYKTDFIPCTQLGMGILSYLKYWEYSGKNDSLPLKYATQTVSYTHLTLPTIYSV